MTDSDAFDDVTQIQTIKSEQIWQELCNAKVLFHLFLPMKPALHSRQLLIVKSLWRGVTHDFLTLNLSRIAIVLASIAP